MSDNSDKKGPRHYEPVDLAAADFKIHQLEGLEKDNIENAFAGYVRQVLGRINDGKEATVYLCEGEDHDLLAAKVFKARHFRHFNTDHQYRDVSKHRDRRLGRAMKKRSRKGQDSFHREWIRSEWDYLNRLYDLGVSVPEPIARSADGVLMSFIGDTRGAAPRLVNVTFESPGEAESCALALYENIRLMLAGDIVHGDLSAYNVLYHGHKPVIIDVPQAMPRFGHPDAHAMMHRDLTNLDAFFARHQTHIAFTALLL